MLVHGDGATGAAARRCQRHCVLSGFTPSLSYCLAAALHWTVEEESGGGARSRRTRCTRRAPQVRLAARASLVGGLPTFALPLLAGLAGEAIDSGVRPPFISSSNWSRRCSTFLSLVGPAPRPLRQDLLLEQACTRHLFGPSGQLQSRMGRRAERRGGALPLAQGLPC